jgi:hypothetical protein
MDLADVVHGTVEQPLGIDLAFAAQRETIESARASDIGKHRLGGRQAPGIDEAAEHRIDFALHLLGVIWVARDSVLKKGQPFGSCSGRVRERLRDLWYVLFNFHISRRVRSRLRLLSA